LAKLGDPVGDDLHKRDRINHDEPLEEHVNLVSFYT